MEVLSGRIILRPSDPRATTRFYRDQLGLAVAREYPGGIVFFAGSTLIEVAAHMDATGAPPSTSVLWLQVRDIAATGRELRAAGVSITRDAKTEPWGLIEMHAADPDGTEIILVEVPGDHPLRRDGRAPD
ncbi:MAG: glyoxalase [Gordonia sp.]|uniref:VOC family protein n=1 Tax=Gordonia rubripertincta TaxID=36822 RepID=A0ABT4MXH8_GORRU|nr:VOC family protein [Gordonia rubripertincta]MBA4020888.1 glyoxalase [Gordonia sp. (in: high G+C Gram-positive bacteria)]MCZ4550721.1 VOC family protein [Gordonia rubripertincta]